MSNEHNPRYMPAPQPAAAINETIQQNLATGDLPPEVLDEIANRVFQQLKSTHLDMHAPPLSSQPPPPPPYNHPYVQPSVSSPSSYSASSPPPVGRNVYTPPSPHRSEEQYYGSPTRPTEHGSNAPIPEKRTVSPTLSQASEASHAQTRPKPPTRDSTGQEETLLEKIWGQLFDASGAPTPRLGQFLRGLAMHLIDDYEPVKSLVITPQKLQKFYADTKLSKEFYKWQDVFDDHTSSISRMYREIEAQHHLVQETLDQRPDVPGLTPQGFERWATLLILAHPDSEFERLQKAVLDMPISNPDDKKERFPKELSKRLFPKTPDFATRDRLEKAMATHCGISIPTPSATNRYASPQRTSPPHTSPPQAQREDLFPSTTSSAPIERQRQPYSGNPSEASDDEGPVTQPIERERQPYSAHPGQGRVYDDATPRPTPSTQPPQTQPPPPINTSRSRTRAESVTNRTRPMSINLGSQRPNLNLGTGDYNQDATLPPFSRTTGTPITTTAAPQRTNRRHSPSMSHNTHTPTSAFAPGDFRRSEGDIFSPGSFPNSGSHGFQPPPQMSSSAYGSIPTSRSGNLPPTTAADEEYYRGRMGSGNGGSINAGGVGYEYGNNGGQGYSGGYR